MPPPSLCALYTRTYTPIPLYIAFFLFTLIFFLFSKVKEKCLKKNLYIEGKQWGKQHNKCSCKKTISMVAFPLLWNIFLPLIINVNSLSKSIKIEMKKKREKFTKLLVVVVGGNLFVFNRSTSRMIEKFSYFIFEIITMGPCNLNHH